MISAELKEKAYQMYFEDYSNEFCHHYNDELSNKEKSVYDFLKNHFSFWKNFNENDYIILSYAAQCSNDSDDCLDFTREILSELGYNKNLAKKILHSFDYAFNELC